MKTNLKSYRLLGALLLGLSVGTSHAQFTTVTCGAVGTNAGAKLKFVNGTSVSVDSGFVQPLVYQRISNRYQTNNFYGTTNLLFSCSSAKTNPATSAAIGSYVVCQILAVSGPAGGVVYFWEQGNGRTSYEFPVGGVFPTGKNRFILSNCENGAGRVDGDPFGTIRGRRFVVNKAGDYTVTFKLYDVSENHPVLSATPIHAPSDPITIKFSTAVDIGITSISASSNLVSVVYKQGALTNLFVETATNLISPSWVAVAGPFTNAPALTTNLFAINPAAEAMFFRLRGETP